MSWLTDSLGNDSLDNRCSRQGVACSGYPDCSSCLETEQVLYPRDSSSTSSNQHAQVLQYLLAQSPPPKQDLCIDAQQFNADCLPWIYYKHLLLFYDLSRLEHETGTLESVQYTYPYSASVSCLHTQKREMLAGKYYLPFDKQLALERQHCNKVCWRFNNCTNPNNSILPKEHARHFGKILQLNKPTNLLPILVSYTLSGCVGNNVIVEALFNCDYRYNIHIEYNVVIGKNYTILDLYKVRIGDRCILGPNVNIYTVIIVIDPKRRPGSGRLNLGNPIVIEEDCWISRGVIILPGQTIKKSSTVGAGSVVTKVCLYDFLTLIPCQLGRNRLVYYLGHVNCKLI